MRKRDTVDLDKMRNEDFKHYSPEVIRKYEDPEYAKAADEYERKARRRAGKHGSSKPGMLNIPVPYSLYKGSNTSQSESL